MKTSDIKGIIPPVITPMNDDAEQTVNHEELRKQVERLLAGGVHGIFPLGTNGEAYALSAREKEEILATVIDQVKGRACLCRHWLHHHCRDHPHEQARRRAWRRCTVHHYPPALQWLLRRSCTITMLQLQSM